MGGGLVPVLVATRFVRFFVRPTHRIRMRDRHKAPTHPRTPLSLQITRFGRQNSSRC